MKLFAGDSSYADTTPAVTGSSYETTTGGANYDNTRTGDISQVRDQFLVKMNLTPICVCILLYV